MVSAGGAGTEGGLKTIASNEEARGEEEVPTRPERPEDEEVEAALAEALEEDPPPAQAVRAMMAAFQQQTAPMPHPLADKITGEHVTQALEIQQRSGDHLLQDRGEQRAHAKFIFVAASVFLLGLIALLVFTGNASQVEEIVTLLFVGAATAVGGWGYAQRSG